MGHRAPRWTTSPCRPPASAPSPARVSPRASPRHPAPPRGAARAAISTDRSAGPRGGWLPLLVQDIAREAGISCVAGWAGRWTGAGPERQLRRHATCGQAASRGTVPTRASRHRMAPEPKADPGRATKTAPRSVSWARGGAPRRVSDPVRLDSRRCTRPHDRGLSEAGRGHSGRPHGRSRACVVRRARPVAATWRRRRPPGGRPWRVPWRRKCALWVCVGRSVDRGSQ